MSQSSMIDLRVVELLCSRLCHDLVGPVAAVNNGIELMRELGSGAGDEAVDLIEQSAEISARRLKYFRAALGAGAILPTEVRLDALQDLAADGLAGTKVQVEAIAGDRSRVVSREQAKLLLNLVLLAAEGLPRGGQVGFELGHGSGSLAVTGRGTGAHVSPAMREALENTVAVPDLEPRTAHAFLVGSLATAARRKITADQAGPDSIRFALTPT
ncbi:MAG: histidine phosphotransferase family protein [Alphaproteobacteria bacterium]